MKKVATDKAPAAIGPYSQAVIFGGAVYTSGQIAIVPETGNIEAADVVGQTEQVMKNLGEVLKAAGTSYDKAIKTTCFLADI
ncbi:MAG: regulator, partial [Clostridia bacterium]|nr:regulator [Clostridia bacterium]